MKEGIAFSNGQYRVISFNEIDPKPSDLIFEPPLPSKNRETYSEYIMPNNLKIYWSYNSWTRSYPFLAEIFYNKIKIDSVSPASCSSVLGLILSFSNKSEQDIIALLSTRESEIVKSINQKEEELSQIEQKIQSKEKNLDSLNDIINEVKSLSEKLNKLNLI